MLFAASCAAPASRSTDWARCDPLSAPTAVGWRSRQLPQQRQRIILDELAASSWSTVGDLVVLLGASHATVRRDLRVLADQGLLIRVHGGAACPRVLATWAASIHPW
jgi:hypothetical protein